MDNLTITFQAGCDRSLVDQLAELIDSTDPALHRFLFRACDDPVQAIADIAMAHKGLFSHTFVHAAIRDAHLAGICLSFLPDHYTNVLDDTVNVLDEAYGKTIAGSVKSALRALMDITPPFPPHSLFVQNFAVATSQRRQGVGKHMMRNELDVAAAHGCLLIALDVNAENKAAIHFYSSMNGCVISQWSGSRLGLGNYFRMHLPVS